MDNASSRYDDGRDQSGYGLTVADEVRLLRIARQFTTETTFLGAHVIPQYLGDRSGCRSCDRADAAGSGTVRALDRCLL
jgi:hypothetical protein